MNHTIFHTFYMGSTHGFFMGEKLVVILYKPVLIDNCPLRFNARYTEAIPRELAAGFG